MGGAMTATKTTVDHDRTALVTGASRGIGYELAKLFANDGYDVVLVARSQDQLEDVAAELERTNGIKATVISMDLSVPGAAEELYDAVTQKDIQVDALVNNAGISIYGHFCDTDFERERALLHLNVTAVSQLTKLFATSMCDRDGGQILNVSSMAGVWPMPKQAVYGATKSYVHSLSVALANELADDDITVTLLAPRGTDTAILEKGGMENSAFSEKDLLDPQAVAQSGYEGLQQGETIVVPGGIRAKLQYQLPRILPESTAAKMSRDHVEPG